jgi:predicted amino acid racemase
MEKRLVALKNDMMQTESEVRQMKEKRNYIIGSQQESKNKSTVLTELFSA